MDVTDYCWSYLVFIKKDYRLFKDAGIFLYLVVTPIAALTNFFSDKSHRGLEHMRNFVDIPPFFMLVTKSAFHCCYRIVFVCLGFYLSF